MIFIVHSTPEITLLWLGNLGKYIMAMEVFSTTVTHLSGETYQ